MKPTEQQKAQLNRAVFLAGASATYSEHDKFVDEFIEKFGIDAYSKALDEYAL